MTPIQKAIDLVGGPSAMARILGVTAQAVCFWRDKKRELPIERCPAIELATSGAVTRRDLRPADWWLIWPELVTAEYQAPATEHLTRSGRTDIDRRSKSERRGDTSPPQVMADKRKAA